MESSWANQELAYVLAYAMMQKKPTFCLYSRPEIVRSLRRYLDQDSQGKFLVFKSYKPHQLEALVKQYLIHLKQPSAEDDVPKIKFTLRLTNRIDKYLKWKLHNTKGTKADFLRQSIKEKIIDPDEKYKKYLQGKK